MYFRCVEMMDIVVHDYLLTPLYFPHVEIFFMYHIIINYSFFEFGNWIHICICAGSGCLILQTLQNPSIRDHEVEF